MITILTHKRNKTGFEYFYNTYDQVADQTDAEIEVFVDGHELPGTVDFIQLPKHSPGNRDAFFMILEYAAAFNEDLIYLEDDIKLSNNAIPYILDFQIPQEAGFTTFFTPKVQRCGAGDGVFIGPPGTFLFLQCVKFKHETVVKLVNWYKTAHPKNNAADQILKQATKELNISWSMHKPDLAQHIGHESSVDNSKLTWWRLADAFVGDV
jgi:hypothetical protein